MSDIKSKIINISPKARQYSVFLVFLSIIMFLGYFMVHMWNPASIKPTSVQLHKTNAIEEKNITAVTDQLDPKQLWIQKSGQQLNNLQDQINKINTTNNDNTKNNQNYGSNELNPTNGSLNMLFHPNIPPINQTNEKPVVHINDSVPPVVNMNNKSLVTLPPPIDNKNNANDDSKNQTVQPTGPSIVDYDIGVEKNAFVNAPSNTNLEDKDKKIYIPAGSFFKVILVGGLDASTSGQSEQNPWPVLMRITDNAVLPNKFRVDVKDCFVLGSGFGDLSSERAYLRLENLSCVMKDGSVIDKPVKGYVAGEDGKAGLRGTVVSKQGRVLANALLSGIVSGIGQGISMSSQNYMVSPLGTTSAYPSTSEAMKGGMGQGVGNAMTTLANYYIQLAEKMFPIVEIDAGRTADVILTKGISIDRQNSNDGEVGGIDELWKRGRESLGLPYDPYPNGINVKQQ